MKLKFDLRKTHIEHLHKILQHIYSNIWSHNHDDEQIFFYFDNDVMVIYPSEKGGFDRVFACIHISNLTS